MKRLVILFLVLSMSACAVLDPQHILTRRLGNQAPLDGIALDAETKTQAFDFVWNRINENYVDPHFRGVDWSAVGMKYRPIVINTDNDDIFWERLDLMTAELGDAHTRVLSAKQYQAVKTKQANSLGLDVAELDNELVVVGVAAGSSAEQAGLVKGNKILEIDGQLALEWWHQHLQKARKNSTERARVSSVKRWLNIGDPDFPANEVKLKMEANDSALSEVSLSRKLITRKDTVKSLVLPSGFAYLRLTGFDSQLARQIEHAFKVLHATSGMIIDLRGNSGGSESLSFSMMNQFVQGTIQIGKHVTRSGKAPSLLFGMIPVSKIDLMLEGSANPYTAPVVILLDAGSASASELFASTLQGLGRASVIGQASCGCLLVYYGYANVPGGGALAYSESDFAPAFGQRIEGRGVLPDIEVVNQRSDLLAGNDRVLLAAEKYLEQKRAEKKLQTNSAETKNNTEGAQSNDTNSGK